MKDANEGKNIILICAEIFKKARESGLKSENFEEQQEQEKNDSDTPRFLIGVKKEAVLFCQSGLKFCH